MSARNSRLQAEFSGDLRRIELRHPIYVGVPVKNVAFGCARFCGAVSTAARAMVAGSGLFPRWLFDFFEIGTLVDRKALQIPAQAIESHFHRTEAHPVAAANNAGAAQNAVVRSG